jgi:hypothetical protein
MAGIPDSKALARHSIAAFRALGRTCAQDADSGLIQIKMLRREAASRNDCDENSTNTSPPGDPCQVRRDDLIERHAHFRGFPAFRPRAIHKADILDRSDEIPRTEDHA